MLTMPDTWLASNIIAGFEGFSSEPYLDEREPPVPTIGYGTTIYPNGRRVTMNDPACTTTQALDWLHFWVTDTAAHLWPGLQTQPTLNQWSALLSVAYNEGWSPIYHSTLVKMFNAGLPQAAANQFLVWDKIRHDGQLVPSVGLLNRRKKERDLFLNPQNVTA